MDCVSLEVLFLYSNYQTFRNSILKLWSFVSMLRKGKKGKEKEENMILNLEILIIWDPNYKVSFFVLLCFFSLFEFSHKLNRSREENKTTFYSCSFYT